LLVEEGKGAVTKEFNIGFHIEVAKLLVFNEETSKVVVLLQYAGYM